MIEPCTTTPLALIAAMAIMLVIYQRLARKFRDSVDDYASLKESWDNEIEQMFDANVTRRK